MSFRENTIMYVLAAAVVSFVILQALFFLIKAWRRGKAIGLSAESMKSAVLQSSLFSIGPALSIAATLLMLSIALGLVVPWIRLSVVGNLIYETTAAETALAAFGLQSGLSSPIENPEIFATVIWVMTLGTSLSLVVIPLFLKKIQQKMGNVIQKDTKWSDIMSAAAFIGIISAFIGRAIAGQGDAKMDIPGSGVLSVATLVFSVVSMLILQKIGEKYNSRFLQNFAMPIAMYAALVFVVVLAQVLPPDIAAFEFRGRV